jgi:hypothetical protein
MRALAFAAVLLWMAGCATISREQALELGSFEVVRGEAGRHGVLIGAPHGTGDTNTGAIARRLARELGLPAVIAWGFTRKESGDLRINVNRPTEGAGLSPRDEKWTARAAHAWEEYRRLMLEAAGGGPPALYIELHCNDHPRTQGMIEVATTGITREQAIRIKGLYYGARDASIRGGVQRVDLRIEQVDEIYMGGGAAKGFGSLALARRSIMIELPLKATPLALEGRPYEKVLAAFLREAIALVEREAR